MSWSADVSAQIGTLPLSVALSGGDAPLLVIGENGAGKTTLLRILAGAMSAKGRIVVGERTLLDTDAGICLPPQERRVGYVPQGYGLFPHLSARDNVAFGLTGPHRRPRAEAMLESMGLVGLADRRPRQLSGGQQQRVALARALITQPRLLLLDEPLAALDVGSRRRMRSVLADHLVGIPSIVVTHDARDVRALGGSVVVLSEGVVVQSGSVSAVSADPATAFVAEFFAT
ncbi:MAG: molybdate transport system ATP-binding protein [Myxococcota bacterium]|jgi:molybdate transport system ATP-binding protein